MIEIFKHFQVYDKSAISESFRPKERVSRKHDFQLQQMSIQGTN